MDVTKNNDSPHRRICLNSFMLQNTKWECPTRLPMRREEHSLEIEINYSKLLQFTIGSLVYQSL